MAQRANTEIDGTVTKNSIKVLIHHMSNRIELNQPAPDFTLVDINGNEVRLSDFQGKKNVLLIFNRGFA